MGKVDEGLLHELLSKDDLVVRLGDALDAKINIGLVLIVFLATQTAYFLEKSLSPVEHGLQVFSIVLLSTAGISSLIGLWPKTYLLPYPEFNTVDRLQELKRHYADSPNSEEEINSEIVRNQIQWAKDRIADNEGKNFRKARMLQWSFWCTAGAMVLNLATLVLKVRSS